MHSFIMNTRNDSTVLAWNGALNLINGWYGQGINN